MIEATIQMTNFAEDITTAARHLAAGDLVAFPTETVYGLGADACSDRAVASIFEAKGRPQFNPLIAHVRDLEMAEAFGVFCEKAKALAEAFWPGPLSLVVPRQEACKISLLVSAGLETICLRVPANPLAQRLLENFEGPIAAPSANLSGNVSPTTADHVRSELGSKVATILDGGPCKVGLESTIVGFDGPRPLLMRPGGVSREALEEVLGEPLEDAVDPEKPHSPGQLLSHYAPNAPVRLNAKDLRPGEVLLAFGSPPLEGASAMLNLSESGDLTEAAANLFSALRRLDEFSSSGIAVMQIPALGLGEAINDRLRKAAAPRSKP